MQDLGFSVGAELGTQYGLSAKLWCEAIPGLSLTCIDPYAIYQARRSQEKQNAVYEEAKKTLSPFNVTLLRERSCDVVDRFPDGSLDLLHIDGDHGFDVCVQDIIHYVPKVRDGGVVVIHDYASFYRGGVVEAVNGYTRCHRISPWYVTNDIAPSVFWQRGAEQA
jgi:predicted O-methyltransferase YrrM